MRDLENASKDKPYSQTLTALNNTLLSTSWPAQEQAALLADLTLADLDTWRSQQFKRLGVRGGLHGNDDTEDAEALAELLTTLLPLDRVDSTRPTVQQLTQSADIDLAVDHNDAALLLYVQDPDDSFASRAKSALAGQLLRSPFFSSLRTDQQLGYVVSAGIRRMDTQSGNLFLVQSPSAGVAHLENAVIEFWRLSIKPGIAVRSGVIGGGTFNPGIAQILQLICSNFQSLKTVRFSNFKA